MTDETLADRTRQGSGTAFADLVARHGDAVYRIAANLCSSPSDVEEATRQTFLRAYRSLRSWPIGASFRTGLYGIAIETALDRRQRARRTPRRSADSFLPRFDAAGRLPPGGREWPELGESRLEGMTVPGLLRGALDSFDDGVRVAFVLCDLADLPAEDAAVILKAPTKVVRERVHCVRLALRGLLDRLWSV